PEVGGRQVLDGRSRIWKALFDGAGNQRHRAVDSRARRAHARTCVGRRVSVVRGIGWARHLQTGSQRWYARGEDSIDEKRSRAARPGYSERRPLVLRRREWVDLPAGLEPLRTRNLTQ